MIAPELLQPFSLPRAPPAPPPPATSILPAQPTSLTPKGPADIGGDAPATATTVAGEVEGPSSSSPPTSHVATEGAPVVDEASTASPSSLPEPAAPPPALATGTLACLAQQPSRPAAAPQPLPAPPQQASPRESALSATPTAAGVAAVSALHGVPLTAVPGAEATPFPSEGAPACFQAGCDDIRPIVPAPTPVVASVVLGSPVTAPASPSGRCGGAIPPVIGGGPGGGVWTLAGGVAGEAVASDGSGEVTTRRVSSEVCTRVSLARLRGQTSGREAGTRWWVAADRQPITLHATCVE